MLLINDILEVFPDMASKINYENSGIKNSLDEVYYYEVYMDPEEYEQNMRDRMAAEAEYYAEHPEELEQMEETEEYKLYCKISEAIWTGNVDVIKECFPEIDKNNKQIQSELTCHIAKYVMKDKNLEKYGLKYKLRKEKK